MRRAGREAEPRRRGAGEPRLETEGAGVQRVGENEARWAGGWRSSAAGFAFGGRLADSQRSRSIATAESAGRPPGRRAALEPSPKRRRGGPRRARGGPQAATAGCAQSAGHSPAPHSARAPAPNRRQDKIQSDEIRRKGHYRGLSIIKLIARKTAAPGLCFLPSLPSEKTFSELPEPHLVV